MPSKLNPEAAPFVLGANALASVELPPAVEDASVSPWNRLPVELKETIIDEVMRCYEDAAQEPEDPLLIDDIDVAVGFFAKREVLEEGRADYVPLQQGELRRLQAVARDFRFICAPLLWETLKLRDVDEAQVEKLLDVLPVHASHVRCLALVDTEQCGLIDLVNGNYLKRQRVTGRATKAINTCVGALEITVDCELLDFSAVRLRRLRSAVLHMASYESTHRAFLRGQTALTSLATEFRHDDEDDSSPRLFVDILKGLPSLKHLNIAGDGIVHEGRLAFRPGTAVRARLESLELVSRWTYVTFATLQAFLAMFSSTLKHLRLELFGTDANEWQLSSSPRDIRLHHLSSFAVGADFAPSFFCRLDLPSLELFCLDLFPSLSSQPGDLLAFLRVHASTLKRVHLTSDAISCRLDRAGWYEGTELADEDVEAIEGCCDALGIELSSGEPWSESDFDDTQFYDEDSDGFGEESVDEDSDIYTDDPEEGTPQPSGDEGDSEEND